MQTTETKLVLPTLTATGKLKIFRKDSAKMLGLAITSDIADNGEPAILSASKLKTRAMHFQQTCQLSGYIAEANEISAIIANGSLKACASLAHDHIRVFGTQKAYDEYLASQNLQEDYKELLSAYASTEPFKSGI